HLGPAAHGAHHLAAGKGAGAARGVEEVQHVVSLGRAALRAGVALDEPGAQVAGEGGGPVEDALRGDPGIRRSGDPGICRGRGVLSSGPEEARAPPPREAARHAGPRRPAGAPAAARAGPTAPALPPARAPWRARGGENLAAPTAAPPWPAASDPLLPPPPAP